MEQLNLPTYSFKIKSDGQRKLIFDTIRKKYVALTPEEWVRQNFIRFLNEVKNYPLSLMSVELHQKIYKAQRRSDIIVFNNNGEPFMIVECKATFIKLDNKVFEQAAGYNIRLKTNYLVVTNGLKHYCCRINHTAGTWEFLDDIPVYWEVKNW